MKLLSVNEAAPILGIAVVTLRRFVAAKKIAHVRIGDRILFRPEDIDSFIASQLVASTSPCVET